MSAATLLQGFAERRAEIDGVATRWFVAGSGPPVVLVHGLAGAATNWTELAPLLAARHRVVVPDLPGHGGSGPLRSADGLGPYAESVVAVAEREGALPAAMVGNSMGGVVVLRAAVTRPDAVSSLVLAGAAGITSTTGRAGVAFAISGLLRPARQAARFRYRIAASPMLRRLVFGYWGAVEPASLTPESVLGLLDGQARHTDVSSAARALLHDDPRFDLERVRCPALVLWGARDRLTPLDDGIEYARRLGAPLRVVPACGHLLIAERAEACAEILLGFLDGVRQVDELPVESELGGQPFRQRADS